MARNATEVDTGVAAVSAVSTPVCTWVNTLAFPTDEVLFGVFTADSIDPVA